MFLAQNSRYPDEVIALLPPTQVECTVEKIVINAVMAGAPPESLELLIAAIASIADPDFELYGVNATTAPVRPEEHTSELQSLMRISYAVFCLKKKSSSQDEI